MLALAHASSLFKLSRRICTFDARGSDGAQWSPVSCLSVSQQCPCQYHYATISSEHRMPVRGPRGAVATGVSAARPPHGPQAGSGRKEGRAAPALTHLQQAHVTIRPCRTESLDLGVAEETRERTRGKHGVSRVA
jgi:hypothetical protein